MNKMDAVEYDRVKYEDVKTQLSAMLKNIGYDVEKIPFIPCSAFDGPNVVKKGTDKMNWYNGPTIVECLDKFEVPPKPLDKPLRLPVQDVFSITGHGTVPVGRVETGTMKPGDKVVFNPSGAGGEVKKIEMHHQELPKAVPGDNVGFNVKGVEKKDIKRGEVVGPSDSPPTVAEEFTAQVVVLEHPTAIGKGYTPVFHIHTAQVACTVTEIVEKKDPKTGQTAEKNPDFIKTGDVAVLKIKPLRPTVIEKFQEFPQLGRFAIRDMGQTVAAGVVLEVKKKG
jgi:elongation factor 1-alpha